MTTILASIVLAATATVAEPQDRQLVRQSALLASFLRMVEDVPNNEPEVARQMVEVIVKMCRDTPLGRALRVGIWP
jgi:hypothetical protein